MGLLKLFMVHHRFLLMRLRAINQSLLQPSSGWFQKQKTLEVFVFVYRTL